MKRICAVCALLLLLGACGGPRQAAETPAPAPAALTGSMSQSGAVSFGVFRKILSMTVMVNDCAAARHTPRGV